jgi:PAS domain S-box-containing protein
MKSGNFKTTIPAGMVIVFIVFSLLVIAGGILISASQKKRIESDVQKDLSAISSLKIDEIISWKNERIGDGMVIRENVLLISQIEDFFRNERDTALQNNLRVWMNSLMMSYGYKSIRIIDKSGSVRLSQPAEDTGISAYIQDRLADIFNKGEVVLSDFHQSEVDPEVHIDVLVPIKKEKSVESKPIGMIILKIDPGIKLFPLIQSWPTPSKTSETLLLRREGDSVLYLNELRFKKNTTLTMKLPMSASNTPAIKAAKGVEGLFEGMDYRHIPVISYLSRIPGTPWFMVAKIDKDEVFTPLRKQLTLTLLIMILLLLAAGSFAAYLWKNQQTRNYRVQYETEHERNRAVDDLRETRDYLESLIKYTNAPFIVWDMNLVITRINPAFEKLIGAPADSVLGRNIDILFPEEFKEESLKYVFAGTIGERWEMVEIPVLHSDGTVKTVLWNSAVIHDKHGSTAVSIIAQGYDITEHKIAESALKESEKLYRSLFENMLNGFAYCRMCYDDERKPDDFIYLAVNNAFETLTGLKNVTGHKVTELIPGFRDSDRGLLNLYGRVASEGKPERTEVFVESMKMWFAISAYSPEPDHFVAVFDVITERKQLEKDLKESEAKFRSLFEFSPLGISMTTIDGSIHVNMAFCKMLGYTEDQLREKNWRDISFQDDLEATEHNMNLLLSGKAETVRFEKRYIHRSGEIIYAYLSTYLHRDKDGNPLYYVTTVNDITERKKLEKERFKLLDIVERSLNEIYLFDTENLKFEYVNQGALKNIGYSLDEMKTMTPVDIKPLLSERDFRKMVQPLLSDEKNILIFETVHRRKNGTDYPVEVHLQLDKQGDRKLFFTIITDLTERNLAKLAIRESEERYRSTLDNMLEGGQLLDYEWRYLYINDAAERHNRRPREELLGNRYQDMWPGIEKTEAYSKMKSCMDHRIPQVMENEFLFPDGTYGWFDLRIQPVPEGIFILSSDITDRKKAERALESLNEQLENRIIQRTAELEAANKELEAFSYSVSHDLRAPLRAVHSYTNILKEEYDKVLDDEGRRICGIIESSSVHMGHLIDDLLSFSRVGRTGLLFSKIDMTALVNNVYSELSAQYEDKDISFKVKKLQPASGDTTTIRLVITNLLSNALKYTSKTVNPVILVASVPGKVETMYYVKDNGVGFDMKYVNKLFGVFQRLHSAKEFEGNGVGLAIVQRIIHRHGGRVWAEAEAGKGATFFFTLPVK